MSHPRPQVYSYFLLSPLKQTMKILFLKLNLGLQGNASDEVEEVDDEGEHSVGEERGGRQLRSVSTQTPGPLLTGECRSTGEIQVSQPLKFSTTRLAQRCTIFLGYLDWEIENQHRNPKDMIDMTATNLTSRIGLPLSYPTLSRCSCTHLISEEEGLPHCECFIYLYETDSNTANLQLAYTHLTTRGCPLPHHPFLLPQVKIQVACFLFVLSTVISPQSINSCSPRRLLLHLGRLSCLRPSSLPVTPLLHTTPGKPLHCLASALLFLSAGSPCRGLWH